MVKKIKIKKPLDKSRGFIRARGANFTNSNQKPTGNRVYVDSVSRVRISFSPPTKKPGEFHLVFLLFLPITSRQALCMATFGCEYMSKVTPTLLWPSTELTILGLTFSANIQVA